MLKPIVLTLCASQFVACATTHSYSRGEMIQDLIIAIGKIANDKHNKIVFSGERYSYIATQGGETVFNIIAQTQPEQRTLINSLPIEFKMISKTDFTVNLDILYERPIAKLNNTEYAHLKSLGFQKTVFRCGKKLQNSSCEFPVASIPLRGRIHEKDNQVIPFLLNQPYPVVINIPKSKIKNTGKSAGNLVKNILITPFAVAGAVIYLPIAIGAILLNYDNPDAWH